MDTMHHRSIQSLSPQSPSSHRRSPPLSFVCFRRGSAAFLGRDPPLGPPTMAVFTCFSVVDPQSLPRSGVGLDCSAPTKGLFITGRWPNLIALFSCADRNEPTLLCYKPNYFGFAYHKDKSKMEQPEQIPIEQSKQQDQHPTTITTEPPRSSRRRPSHSAGKGADRRAKKRAKVAEDDVEFIGASHVEDNASEPDESPDLFVSNVQYPDGHVITAVDSLAENPLLPMTLLNGVALPNDMRNLQEGKANNMVELCLFIAKVGQCVSRAFSDMDAVIEASRSLRGDLKVKREEAKMATEEIEKLEEKVADVAAGLKERDRLLIEVKDLKAEWDQLKEEKKHLEDDLPRKLKEAGEHYKEQVESLPDSQLEPLFQAGANYPEYRAQHLMQGFRIRTAWEAQRQARGSRGGRSGRRGGRGRGGEGPQGGGTGRGRASLSALS
ncbi:hypothetical protein RHSIM_Rhsim10G0097000 [Rhododendron simsii]|uniref:Uncharacterized protein n=1 Tax=Rhododendron simsii TaxID=118357 RepID=A0A834GAP1_RHOSS|nr:hypothetical protein RHSIM_Rhsim10G0097000 [Rhododendron simsii]